MAADRNFVVLGHRAHTAPDWKLDDLCGGGGRLDVLVRCVTAAMWVSHGLRRDTLLSVPNAAAPALVRRMSCLYHLKMAIAARH